MNIVAYLDAKFEVSNNYSYGNKAKLKRKYKSSLIPISWEFKKPTSFLVYVIKKSPLQNFSFLNPRVWAGR